MNTIKTICISAILLAIGYGTHKVLHSPGDQRLTGDGIWALNDDNGDGVDISGIPGGDGLNLPRMETSALPPNPFQDGTASPTPTFDPQPMPSGATLGTNSQPQTRLELVEPDTSRYGNTQRPDLGIGQMPTQPNTIQNNLPPLTPPQPLSPGNDPLQITNAGPMNTPPLPTATPTVPSNAITLPPPPHHTLEASPTDLGMATPAGPGSTFDASTLTYETPVGMPSTPAAPSNQSFDTIWRSGQDAIGQGKLSDALSVLSSAYNLPLDNTQRGQLIPLLDKLAGTVIYSQQHLLHPAYAPRHAETIAQVAMRQRVPADFLARVNQVNPHQPLTPDMKLKIVTGPFRGELSRERRELTVFLGNQYAGRFSVSLGKDFPAQATSFEIFEKSGTRVYNDPRTGQPIPAGSPANPYGSHWIGLRADGVASYTCGMHSVGADVDASDSRGCIALTHEDADDLKAILELGSTLMVVR